MKKRICIVSDKHLCTNPRVWKEAETLVENGYEVSIVTRFTSAALRKRDEDMLQALSGKLNYIPAVNLIPGEGKSIASLFYRMRTKGALIAKQYLGIDSPYLLSSAPELLTSAALREGADLYIVHTEIGLVVGKELVSAGQKVAFDIEDWYSRDYLVPTRPVKLLSSLERFALHNGVYVSCPSGSMSEALHLVYGGNKPVVLYNSFPAQELFKKEEDSIPSLIWFSQTIGPGRGLEKIINTLKHVDVKVRLTLVGDCKQDYMQKLQEMMPVQKGHELIILPQVNYHDLHRFLCRFDIGLALEEKTPDNKEKTISNKMFQYLQAGLKVLATDTDGQKEIADHFQESVLVVDTNNTSGWSAVLLELINNKVNKQALVDKYNAGFSWDNEEKKLLSHVEATLN